MSARFEYSIVRLACGSNGSGLACVLVVSKFSLYNDEKTEVEMTLINAVLTSLAPHNVSGLAGILLSLSDSGKDRVTIIGPAGVEGMLHNMQPFCNRKYPAIDIIEIQVNDDTKERRVFKSDHQSVTARPLWFESERDRKQHICAISVTISLTHTKRQSSLLVIPIERSFPTFPSITSLLQSSSEARVALFVPSSVSSMFISDHLSKIYHRHNERFEGKECGGYEREDLDELCNKQNILGVLFDGKLRGPCVEFPRPQHTLKLLRSLCPAFFPRPLLVNDAAPAVAFLLGVGEGSRVSDGKEESATSEQKRPAALGTNEGNIVEPEEGFGLIDACEFDHVVISSASQPNLRRGGICFIALKLTSEHDDGEIELSAMERLTAARTEARRESSNGRVCGPDDLLSSSTVALSQAVLSTRIGTDAASNQDSAILIRERLKAEVKRPKLSTDDSSKIPKSTGTMTLPLSEDDSPNRFAALREAIDLLQNIPPPTPLDAHITFLGTGSATPSTHRSSSAVLIQLPSAQRQMPVYGRAFVSGSVQSAQLAMPPTPPPPVRQSASTTTITTITATTTTINKSRHNFLLLDAGEGTCAQLFQSVSGEIDRFDTSLMAISLVWLSHHHADHICGFMNLIENIQRARWRFQEARKGAHCESDDLFLSRRILVIASPVVSSYYEYALNISGLDDLVEFLPIRATTFAGIAGSVLQERTSGSLLRLVSIPVQHCRDSYGVVLELSSGHKMVYSGDCRPSASLVAAGRGCDLIIHEATFGDDMVDDAERKQHCTTSEALHVARQCMVDPPLEYSFSPYSTQFPLRPSAGSFSSQQKQRQPTSSRSGLVVLTHFSQRYPHAPQTQIQSSESCSSTDHPPLRHFVADCSKSSSSSSGQNPSQSPLASEALTAVSLEKRGNIGETLDFAVAFDFLRFAFPSHSNSLPRATRALVDVFAALDTKHEAEAS